MNKVRFGIVGPAQIARKNWRAIFHSGNSEVTAVASRDLGRSRKFIVECQAEVPFETEPAAFGSYDELLASKYVDAVYIPLPTGLRKEWVVRAAEAGKHIVCEKPCAVSAGDLEEMISACRKNRVQFMDGVMFMHNRRLEQIRETLNDGNSVGKVKRICSNFSFLGAADFLHANIRASQTLEPAGCLGDLGWYCIRFALWTMNWEMPHRVDGKIISRAGNDPSGVPVEFSGELFFDGGVSSGFYCSFLAANLQTLTISGEKGYLNVHDFVNPFRGEAAFETVQVEFQNDGANPFARPVLKKHPHIESGDHPATAQESNMFRNFANQIFTGKLNDAWPEIALKTQRVQDACLEAARNKLET
ncbi:MAG TPA: Gfo/Idh/MocA family oxidoreductase [Verrucomicrobiae bacterium]